NDGPFRDRRLEQGRTLPAKWQERCPGGSDDPSDMEYHAKVVYERDVISEAARRFVFRSIRWDGFAVFFALVAALGYLLATGDRSWIVGFVAAVVLLMAIFGVAL